MLSTADQFCKIWNEIVLISKSFKIIVTFKRRITEQKINSCNSSQSN